MLRIGFSKKYFTLWNVTEKKTFAKVGGMEIPFKEITSKFIRNLSFDEGFSKRKAIFEGVENFDIDFSLCGIKYLLQQYEEKSEDELFFLFCETRNEAIKEILIQRGFVDYEGQIIYPEHYEKILKINSMKTNKERVAELTEKITEIYCERKEVAKLRLTECEFAIGEKVKVFSPVHFRYKENEDLKFEGIGFVEFISVDEHGDFVYRLKKAKKDGTKSSFGFGYRLESYKIEKL